MAFFTNETLVLLHPSISNHNILLWRFWTRGEKARPFLKMSEKKFLDSSLVKMKKK